MDAEQKLLEHLKSDAAIHQVEIHGLLINYVQTGSGKPLLLLHGANMGWGQWYANIDELSKHFTVYALDLPGAGNSTKIPYQHLHAEKHFVDIVDAFIEQKGLTDISVVAHSVGAWVALKLILRERANITKAALISPMGFSKYNPIQYSPIGIRAIAKFLSKTVMNLTRPNIKKFVESGFKDPKKLTDLFLNYYYDSVRHSPENHPLLLLNAFTGILQVKKEFVLLESLGRIRIPVLIVVGEYDKIVSPHQRHQLAFARIPHSKIEIIKNTGHVPFIEETEKFNELILRFLTHAT
jgi:2-hydroxy-6-oxonona-2,4-dienedioate hydrolase